jgi:hypothetical protein
MVKKKESKEITGTSGTIRRVTSYPNEGVFVYVPIAEGIFRGRVEDPNFWTHDIFPGWVQSEGEIWLEDEEMIDFGGVLTKELIIQLGHKDVRIIHGSIETRRWRIALPKAHVNEVKKLLLKNKVDFIQKVTTIPNR